MDAQIREGLIWVWKQPVIRFLTLIQAADNLRYGAGYLLIILLANRIGAMPLEIGLIFSGTALGAMLGALVSARLARRYPLGQVAVVMLWVEALLLAMIGPQELVLLSGIWLLLLAIATTANRTVRQAPVVTAVAPVQGTDSALRIHGDHTKSPPISGKDAPGLEE